MPPRSISQSVCLPPLDLCLTCRSLCHGVACAATIGRRRGPMDNGTSWIRTAARSLTTVGSRATPRCRPCTKGTTSTTASLHLHLRRPSRSQAACIRNHCRYPTFLWYGIGKMMKLAGGTSQSGTCSADRSYHIGSAELPHTKWLCARPRGPTTLNSFRSYSYRITSVVLSSDLFPPKQTLVPGTRRPQ